MVEAIGRLNAVLARSAHQGAEVVVSAEYATTVAVSATSVSAPRVRLDELIVTYRDPSADTQILRVAASDLHLLDDAVRTALEQVAIPEKEEA